MNKSDLIQKIDDNFRIVTCTEPKQHIIDYWNTLDIATLLIINEAWSTLAGLYRGKK